MKKLLLAALFALVSGSVSAQTINAYWQVGDTNPTTQVWQTSTGGFISNTNGTYETWLGQAAAGAFPTLPFIAGTVCGANNNAGAVQLIMCNPGILQSWINGQTKTIFGVNGVPGANGAFPINVDSVPSGLVTLTGSTFSGAWTSGGVIGAAPFVATAASMLATIDQYNRFLYYSGQTVFTPAGLTATVTLPCPISPLYVVTMGAGAQIVTLPAENLACSPPLGMPIMFFTTSGSNGTWTLKDSAGNTVKSGIAASTTMILESGGNNGPAGGWYYMMGTQ